MARSGSTQGIQPYHDQDDCANLLPFEVANAMRFCNPQDAVRSDSLRKRSFVHVFLGAENRCSVPFGEGCLRQTVTFCCVTPPKAILAPVVGTPPAQGEENEVVEYDHGSQSAERSAES
jgi:hypothetical protein